MTEVISPLADKSKWQASILDYNVRAEKMGWLPSAPQLNENPLGITKKAEAAGLTPQDFVVKNLKNGELKFACEDPDAVQNHPHNMFIWRSN